MSRLSSSRVAIESRIERIDVVEIAEDDDRLSSAFIGASSTGSVASEPARNEFTQRTSRNSRMTWMKESRMPTSSTPMIRPLRPGLVLKALLICRVRIAATNPTMARKTSMDSRNTWGLERSRRSYSTGSSATRSIPSDLSSAIGAPRLFPNPKSVGDSKRNCDEIERQTRPAGQLRVVARRQGTPSGRLRAGGNGGARFELSQQCAVNGLVARDDRARAENVLGAAAVGDEPSGFADHQHARTHVPGRQRVLPETVEAAGRHVGEVERGGAEPANAGNLSHHVLEVDQGPAMVASVEMRNSGADHRVGEPAAGGHSHAPVVQERPAAALGRVEFVHRRIEDHAGNQLPLPLERNGDGEYRNAVQEIRGAVERINQPAVLWVVAFNDAALLHQEGIAGPGARQLVEDDLLGPAVCLADIVARALQRDLQVLHLAEIARERAAGLGCRLHHDVEESGAGHLSTRCSSVVGSRSCGRRLATDEWRTTTDSQSALRRERSGPSFYPLFAVGR